MDHNDREQFWKTLCSLPGNDIVAEREQAFHGDACRVDTAHAAGIAIRRMV